MNDQIRSQPDSMMSQEASCVLIKINVCSNMQEAQAQAQAQLKTLIMGINQRILHPSQINSLLSIFTHIKKFMFVLKCTLIVLYRNVGIEKTKIYTNG